MRMNTQLSPIESEFATLAEAEAHDRWFRAKVQEALDSKAPGVPHDQVLAKADALIAAARAKLAQR